MPQWTGVEIEPPLAVPLAPNCSVTYDLDAKSILRTLIGAERQHVAGMSPSL